MIISEIMPVIFGFIIIVAILVPCILLLIWYKKYLRLAKTLPDPESIEQTQSETIDEKHNLLTSTLLDGWSKIPEHEIDVTRDALWTAMLLVAVSDSSIDQREIKFVADLFVQIGGNKNASKTVFSAAVRVEGDKKSTLKEISKARKVSTASKECILAGAFLVSVSDHALTDTETACLGSIADALAIKPRERKAIFEDITKRFGI